MSDLTHIQNDPPLQTLVGQLRDLIRDARGRALRAVDAIQVRTCWEIGWHIVEFEQGGAARAKYGKRLLPKLAESLTAEFGRGFDATNLRHMRSFFLAFPIRDALRRELSWTHYRSLLLLAQMFCAVRSEIRGVNAPGCRANGYVCAHVR